MVIKKTSHCDKCDIELKDSSIGIVLADNDLIDRESSPVLDKEVCSWECLKKVFNEFVKRHE